MKGPLTGVFHLVIIRPVDEADESLGETRKVIG